MAGLKIDVLVFAGLAEAVGGPSVALDVRPPLRVADVKRAVAARYPGAAEQVKGCFAAINQSYAADDAMIGEGDEVALIPPVSGG